MSRKLVNVTVLGTAHGFLALLAWCAFASAQPPALAASQFRAIKQEVPPNPSTPAAPAQPIPYSHKTHLAIVGEGECQTCHTAPAPGKQMTFPATAVCMQCHAKISAEKPAIQKLAEFDRAGKPVPWVRVYTLRPGVEWTHQKHVDAKVACETCHGDVAQMDVMTEATSVTSMGGCMTCHTSRKAQGAKSGKDLTACTTCHVWFDDPGRR